ncbi:hypothetical protein CLV71_123189 [Actinophytocola oryzae]|uniref:Uncharacterized protein n=1 Tax=Actinophytocola oryzae TaxID=502181 RepID=A0A4R7UUV3_9PSEU|nr:hypothetical protein CLV71_123189 [Actinophytocola oryzae]
MILYNATTDNLAPLAAQAAAQGTPPPAMDSISDLPEPVRTTVAGLLADAFSSTFVWALVLLAIAFIPALFLPRGRTTPAMVEGGVVPSDMDGSTRDEAPEPAADRR